MTGRKEPTAEETRPPETTPPGNETKPPESETPKPGRKRAGRLPSRPGRGAGPIRTLSDLAHDPDNPRDIEPEALEGLKVSLSEFGDLSGIVFNVRTGQLIAGHQRRDGLLQKFGDLPLQREGDRAFMVTPDGKRFDVRLVDWDVATQRAANFAANNPHIAGHFTPAAQGQLEDIRTRTAALFKSLRLDRLAKKTPRKGRAADDDVPPIPAKAKTKPGDLYQLGRHRLLCGDCKVPGDVARLMDGVEPPGLLLTDPPYCSGGFQEAQRGAGTWGDIAADNLSTRGYQVLIKTMLENLRIPAAYLFTDWRMWITLSDLSEAAGLAVRQMIVWDKGQPGLGALWRPQHELILFGSRGVNPRTPGESTLGNVIQCARTGNEHHYTEKPVDLLVKILENDEKGDREACPVVDTFAGSGPTLLACEKLDRPCYALEVEPRHCDVIVTRWEAFTGHKAKLVR